MSTDADQFLAVDDHTTLCYRVTGDEGQPTILLIAGLGQQLLAWPEEFCSALSARGFRVVRFDNRDVGRSSQHGAPVPTPLQLTTRRGWSARQYSVDDMAIDTCGLIDGLDLAPVHLVGMSMGGMIAQNVASRFPNRVASLTSLMSMTGARGSGRPALSTWLRMAGRPPATRAQAADGAARFLRHIASAGYPFDEAAVRRVAEESWDRSPVGPKSHEGVMRQMAAIMKSGDRTAVVRDISCPTLVLHGDRDRMVHPSGAVATASAISGARSVTVAGLGHDLPVGAWPTLIDHIASHASAHSRVPAGTAS